MLTGTAGREEANRKKKVPFSISSLATSLYTPNGESKQGEAEKKKEKVGRAPAPASYRV